MKQMRRDGVPSTITLYAIRGLTGRERDAVLRGEASSLTTAGTSGNGRCQQI